jgi:hypothetical protein
MSSSKLIAAYRTSRLSSFHPLRIYDLLNLNLLDYLRNDISHVAMLSIVSSIFANIVFPQYPTSDNPDNTDGDIRYMIVIPLFFSILIFKIIHYSGILISALYFKDKLVK